MNTKVMQSALGLISDTSRHFIESNPGLFINGQWTASNSDQTTDVIDPSTATIIGKTVRATAQDVDKACSAAKAAFAINSPWRKCSPQDREKLLNKLADAIEEDSETLADLIAADLGLPRHLALGFEVLKTVQTFRYFAGFPTKIKGETIDIDPDMHEGDYFSYTTKEPVGVVGAIIPWNAPLMIASWKLAPALAAGCTVVMKPAEDASLVVLRLAELVRQVGFPAGVFNVVTGEGPVVGEAILDNPNIDKFAFTGSTSIGKHIHEKASNRMVRLSLELGGKNPVIVMGDADLEPIVPMICMATFANSGQICVSGSKVIAHTSIAEKLAKACIAFTENLPQGNALQDGNMIGPMCSAGQFERVMNYIKLGEKEGRVLVGGKAIESDGYFIKPTIITDLPKNSALLTEEIFGPVMTIETFDDINEVIEAANASDYGLCATIFGSNHATLQRTARDLRVGTVFINSAAFPPAGVPTGGFRQSGVGRDLGTEGLGGYLESKSVIARIGEQH
ncbi:aldehyde dehydrogenase family protein [Pseudocolwellia sp. HL-MZ19]|uniref:aldehyde dehydrogenase family protein n=1 Tax=Pseudocolwellia sp. HL-MZ19 TaxID=3400846 RepID=UPI003CEEA7E9